MAQQNRGHGDDGDERRSPQQSQQHLPLRLQAGYIRPVRSSPSAPGWVRGSGPGLAPLATGLARGRALAGGHGGLGGFGVSQWGVGRAVALEPVASEHITLCFYSACTSEARGEFWRAFYGWLSGSSEAERPGLAETPKPRRSQSESRDLENFPSPVRGRPRRCCLPRPLVPLRGIWGIIWGEFGGEAPTTPPWGWGSGGGALLTHLHGRRLLGTERPSRAGRQQESDSPPGRASSSAAPRRPRSHSALPSFGPELNISEGPAR